MGIEALSRGAKSAVFVELDRKAAGIIKQNLESTGLTEQAEVYTSDAVRSLNLLDRRHARFDVVFLGAPYDSLALEQALSRLAESNLLKAAGIAVAEHRKQQKLQDVYGKLKLFREAKYGETVFTFYESGDLSR